MLETVKGNIWDILEPGDIFIHGCNMQGVMGSGIALQVRNLVPEAYEAYMNHKNKQLGEVSLVHVDRILYVNAITQQFYGSEKNIVYVNYHAVQTALLYVRKLVSDVPLYNRVVFPFIGGGRANGDRTHLLQLFKAVFDHPVKGVLVLEKQH